MRHSKSDVKLYAETVGGNDNVGEYTRIGQDKEIKMVVDDYARLQKKFPKIFEQAVMDYGYAGDPSILVSFSWLAYVESNLEEVELSFKDDGTLVFEVDGVAQIIQPSEKQNFVKELSNRY